MFHSDNVKATRDIKILSRFGGVIQGRGFETKSWRCVNRGMRKSYFEELSRRKMGEIGLEWKMT